MAMSRMEFNLREDDEAWRVRSFVGRRWGRLPRHQCLVIASPLHKYYWSAPPPLLLHRSSKQTLERAAHQ
jgi:hypothetical protein